MKKFKNLQFKIEQGTIVMVFAAVLVGLTGLCALAVDVAGYYAARAEQVAACEMAKSTLSDEMTLIKFSNAPGNQLATTTANIVRENGFSGNMSIYFFENGDTSTDRYFTYAIAAHGVYRTNLGQLVGVSQLPVDTIVFGSGHLYSSIEVWTPATLDNGTFELSHDSSSFHWIRANSMKAFPDEIQRGFEDMRTE